MDGSLKQIFIAVVGTAVLVSAAILVWTFVSFVMRRAAKAGTVVMSTASQIARDSIKREEDAYAQVAHEVDQNDLKQGLWAKAFADANGDLQKQKALYLKYRVGQILRGA